MRKSTLLLIFFAAAANAATFVVPSDREMIRRADLIVIGESLDSYSQYNASGGIETVTPFSIEQVLKGSQPRQTIDVVEPGGTLHDRSMAISGTPRFEVGQRHLLFLRSVGDDRYAVAELILGQFRFAAGISGRQMLVREEEGIEGWDSDLRPHRRAYRLAEGFLSFIRKETAGVASQDNYVVPIEPLRTTDAALTPQPNAVFSATSYTMTINGTLGSRWTVFPNPVTFFAGASGEPGAPGNGVTAVQTALAAWTNDPASNVNYVYGGTDSTHTQGLHAADGANTILFERDLSAWGVSPFACTSNSYSGTLGLGGVTSAGSQHTFNGEAFMTTGEGDVEMNRGLANCTLLFSNGDFNSAVAHELGHTLGFRHSDQNRDSSGACTADPSLECSNQAIMKSFVSQGLNAALQVWDQHAVDTVYPGGTTSGTTTTVRGDFNGDLKPDLVWRNTITGANRIWFMNGITLTGSAALQPLTDLNWSIGGVGDINRDGFMDLIWHNDATGATTVWYMNNTFLASGSVSATIPGWSLVSVNDLNGDGFPDFFWRKKTTGENAVWVMNRRSVIGNLALPPAFTDYSMVGTADFNQDGVPDIVWQSATGQLVLWELNRSGLVIGSADFGIASSPWHAVALGDYNGDGSPDLVFRNSATGANVVWFYRGIAFAGSGDLPSEANVGWSITAPK
jgi:hypothetical protein